ncbi:hypothetical protein HNQ69_001075 [Bartonella callosciuri]|uniref:Autotransporter domain-containing protein n=2 Tax=Bartonella callosciuri TaxID=686223 RepID=A0A840NXA1_9HYPH|nr:hypothetical protein [Bartonella callosciuri]
MQNINAKAQDKPFCGPLLKVYSCDDLSSDGVLYQNNFDIGSLDAMIIKKSEVIRAEKKTNSHTGEILQFKNSETITSEVFAPKKTITVLENVFVITENKEANSSDDSVSHTVFGVQQGGSLFIKNSNVNVTDVHGIAGESLPWTSSLDQTPQFDLRKLDMSRVVAENLKVKVKGTKSYGLYFRGSSSQDEYEEGELRVQLGDLQFKKSILNVPDSAAVYIDDARRYLILSLLDGSSISGDLLLEAKNHSFIRVEANASSLVGGARVDSGSYTEFELSNNSRWTLRPSKKSNLRDGQFGDSSVSFIKLIGSSIFFTTPTAGTYQTLHIGTGLATDSLDYVYIAEAGARLYVNTYFTADNQKERNKTDRVLIYGNVSGTTTVHVRGVSAVSGEKKNYSENNQSISIIQVYGKAEESSFKLPGGYAVLKGSPYKYILHAYGPKEAKNENRLIKGNGDFWDFRLERQYITRNSPTFSSKLKKSVSLRRKPRSVEASTGYNSIVFDSDSSVFDPEVGISAVVPQVPTYLLLPNALFHAGLMDVSNQNKQLEKLWAGSEDLLKNGEKPAFFVRGYGGSHRYVSDLSALEYGYGGNLDYSAVEASVLLKVIEGARHSTSFGVMGTYGKLSLHPQDVEQSQKSTFDKWSVTAYGSMRHDAGFYVDGLFSYGLFKGDVLTLARGKTATLKSNPLNASLTVGKAFMTGHEGLVFDPQIQVIYQNLQFDKASDIDSFDIEMEKPDQWVMRVGGRLTKTLAASEEGCVVSFNGKFHLTRSFGEKQFVHLGDAFQLGAFGSSLESGLGFNAQLSSNFAFHVDMTYQQRLGKSGFSGVSVSGGLRYRF